jgi:predicted N-acetyltransferase YhbS
LFHCDRPLVTTLLHRALRSSVYFIAHRRSRAYFRVALSDEELVGYYTLVFGQVEYNDAPERLSKRLARHPVPIMLLARLAVAIPWQGKGLGSGLLRDAMLRTLQAADIAGIRVFEVHAKDDEARAFYEHFDFVPSPSDPYHLFRLLKDLRKLLRS